MNPFIDEPVVKKEEDYNVLPLYKEYAFDFENDHFLVDADGRHIMVEKNEAIKVWIYKALKTERWRYLAYHNEYGAELEQFIGMPNTAITGERMKLYIKEALLVNPYILSVDKITIQKMEGDIIILFIALTTIYGSMQQEVKVNA